MWMYMRRAVPASADQQSTTHSRLRTVLLPKSRTENSCITFGDRSAGVSSPSKPNATHQHATYNSARCYENVSTCHLHPRNDTQCSLVHVDAESLASGLSATIYYSTK